MSLDDDSLLALYNAELIALSARAESPQRLLSPQYTAHAVSPICGSEVDIDIDLDDKGLVSKIGFAVEACALTKTVVAVLAMAAIGKTAQDIAAAGQALEKLLSGEDVLFEKEWEKLRILAPVKEYKARHNAVLLPFEAVEKALGNKAFTVSP